MAIVGHELGVQSGMSFSQYLPVNPDGHVHVNVSSTFVHVAPFSHTLSSHGLYSYSQPIPVNSAGHEQLRPDPKSRQRPSCMHGLPMHRWGEVWHFLPSVPDGHLEGDGFVTKKFGY